MEDDMIVREDCIVINEFVIYPTGAVYIDQTLVFSNETLANQYLQEYWYDRYGEQNIKVCHSNSDDSIVKTRYNYVEVSELGMRDGSDISRRCFEALWCTTIKKKSDLL